MSERTPHPGLPPQGGKGTPAVRKTAAWLGVCIACVSGFEGLRTVAYRDPVGIPTVCFGETAGVHMGDRYSPAECREMLGDRVEQEFGPGVDRCINHALDPYRKAAYVSFAYNVGVDAFCRSTLARKENARDFPGACDELLRWNKARGVVLPGLTKRRHAEREMCLKGVEDGTEKVVSQ